MPISLRLASSQYDEKALVRALVDLNKGLDRTTKATEESTKAARGPGRGNGGGGGFLGSSLLGFSAARQVVGSIPGGGFVGSALSGASVGGLPGAVVGLGGGVLAEGTRLAIGAAEAGRQARLGAPIGASVGRQILEGREASREFGIEFNEKARTALNTELLGGLRVRDLAFGPFSGLFELDDKSQDQRKLLEERARRAFVVDAAADQAADLLGGAAVDEETARKVVGTFKRQRQRLFDARKQLQKFAEQDVDVGVQGLRNNE